MGPVASFEIRCAQFLDPQGRVTEPLPAFAADPAELIAMYRAMQLSRSFDAKAIALQRTGKIGTFASALGQEAIGVGTALAMRPDDVLLPSYRDHAAQFVRGMRLSESLLYWGGDERGSDFAGPRGDFANAVPIATQVCHAAGVAYAFRLRRETRAAVCLCGDGATSRGDFYEGLNMAGVWGAPMVLVVNNNGWAISVPLSKQTKAQTLAQKAIAAGIEGLQVDGNDVIAVRQVVEAALAKARNGGGPTLIEALTYRLGDHTTADDASRYRDAELVRAQWANEPIARLRKHLVNLDAWDKTLEDALQRELAAEVEQAVADYLAVAPPPVGAMFEHLYAQWPAALEAQRAEAQRWAAPAAPEGDRHG